MNRINKRNLLSGGALLIIVFIAGLSFAFASAVYQWVSPSGFNDSESVWSDEVKAYDENTTSYAVTDIPHNEWSGFLELTLTYHILASSLRVFVGRENSYVESIDIDLWNVSSASWVGVYQGDLTVDAWWQFNFSSVVTNKTRIRAYCSSLGDREFYVYEVDFWHSSYLGFMKHGDCSFYGWLGCGRVWATTRFYSSSFAEWEMSIARHDNASDRIALQFANCSLSYWDRREGGSWVGVGSYPSGVWLEAWLGSTQFLEFWVSYADNGVKIIKDDDFRDDTIGLGLQNRVDWFNYTLSFSNGAVCWDNTYFKSQHGYFFWWQGSFGEEFEDDNHEDWTFYDKQAIIESSYEQLVDIDVVYFWLSGGSKLSDVGNFTSKAWWEVWTDRMTEYFVDVWEGVSTTLLNIPLVGEFAGQLWAWFDFGLGFVGSLWAIVVANLPLLLSLLTLCYFGSIAASVMTGRVDGIKEAFVKPVQDLVSAVNAAAGVIGTIWSFIKFW